MVKKWFKKAVYERSPYTLGGWGKHQSSSVRRQLALASRPKSLSLKNRRLSAARALQSLANVTKDPKTKVMAQRDANYFYRLI
jgi:hypothetical protein